MIIRYTKKFEHEYRKLPLKIKIKAENKENLFRKNHFSTILKIHKLSGGLGDLWAFSIDYKYRIIFEFGKNNIIFFHSVGSHNIYK